MSRVLLEGGYFFFIYLFKTTIFLEMHEPQTRSKCHFGEKIAELSEKNLQKHTIIIFMVLNLPFQEIQLFK